MQLGNKKFYTSLGIVGLLSCVLLYIYRWHENHKKTEVVFEALSIYHNEDLIKAEDIAVSVDPASSETEATSTPSVTYFVFDPNTASQEDFIRLGIQPRVAKNIIKYRNAGGKFYKPQDFKKIYTLPASDYERLLPYLKIATKADRPGNTDRAPYQPKTNHEIEINSADIETWMQQKGIGQGFATRIINFREKLGGFTTAEQLQEVYGLPDSTYQALLPFMRVNTELVNRININTATVEMLANHPYINKTMATHIIKLRSDLGKFEKISDLRMVPLINEEKYRKIAQYLRVD